MGRNFLINGNLGSRDYGLKNFQDLQDAVQRVTALYERAFGENIFKDVKLYIDNATANSGYLPITTVVFNQFVIVKLGISPSDGRERIIYQFSHELMHVVFLAVKGLYKPWTNQMEESVCTAASLIALRELCPTHFQRYNEHVKGLTNDAYRMGARTAEQVNYELPRLMNLVKSIRY